MLRTLRASSAHCLTRLELAAAPLVTGGRWGAVAAILGGGPVLACYACGLSVHQLLTAVLLGWCCLPLVVRNARWSTLGLIAATFLMHSAVAI